MKILQVGVLPTKEIVIYRGECENCHCRLECTEDELSKLPVGKIDLGTRFCPTPGCRLTITLTKVTMRSGDAV